MFRHLKATNFLSWKELEFSFENGITLISGFNHDDNTSEGSGKSSVINALCWCLYSKLPKDTNIDDVIKHGETSCSVVVQLDNGISIHRIRYPNDVYYTVGSNDIPVRGKDAKETQKLIEGLLGISFNTFCEAVYFPQNAGFKFIGSTEEDKAKILSELQDLTIFDKARKKSSEKLKELELQKIKICAEIESVNQALGYISESQISAMELKYNFEVEKEQELALKMQTITKFENTLKEISDRSISYNPEIKAELKVKVESLFNQIKDIRKASNELNDKKSRIEESLNNETEKLKELEEAKSCPTCGGDISAENRTDNHFAQKKRDSVQKVERLRDIYQQILSDLQTSNETNTENLELELSSTRELLDAQSRLESTHSMQTISKKATIASLERAQADYERYKNRSADDFDKKIAELNERSLKFADEHIQLDILVKQLNLDINVYTTLKDSFKEIKQYIFQSILDDLNYKANTYAAQLFEVPIKIEFTNEGEGGEISKIVCNITLDGITRGYGLLSGGQSKRVELSVNLALNDIISSRNGGRWDIRIFDEVFQNLSEDSMTKAIGLFEKLKGKTIIIEHNTIAQSIVNNVFEVEYRNGESRKTI